MELFKSFRELLFAAGFAAALDGRPIPAGCAGPKKSKPIRESDCFADCGAGCVAGAAGLLGTTSVVLGRAGGSKSSKRLMFVGCAGWGGACTHCADCLAPAACFCEVLLSILAFSCTTFKGTSSSSPNVEGSGIGPSITHLLDSYFVLMKFSIFDSDGTCPVCSFDSQYLFARVLPHLRTL